VISKPARQAIECKNLGKKIGIGKIDEFVGKLSHVGILRIPGHREHPFRFIVSTIPAPS
jgi:hypothetical protein